MPKSSNPFELLQLEVVGAYFTSYNSVLCATEITVDVGALKRLIY